MNDNGRSGWGDFVAGLAIGIFTGMWLVAQLVVC